MDEDVGDIERLVRARMEAKARAKAEAKAKAAGASNNNDMAKPATALLEPTSFPESNKERLYADYAEDDEFMDFGGGSVGGGDNAAGG